MQKIQHPFKQRAKHKPRHAARRLVLSFPHGAWYIRLGLRVVNTGMWARRCGVRFYGHAPSAIRAVAVAAGVGV